MKNLYLGNCKTCKKALKSPSATGNCKTCKSFSCEKCHATVIRYSSTLPNNNMCGPCNTKMRITIRRASGVISWEASL